jgi:hypothetical protein
VEKLQLRRDFPPNPLIKTYVSLWGSCRSIAPLQLLFLEIFKFYSRILRFAFLKGAKPNESEHPCTGSRSRAMGAAVARATRRRPHPPAYGCTGVSVVDLPVPRPLRIIPPRYEPRPGAHLCPAVGPADHAPARGPAVLRDRACKGPTGPRGLKASAATSSMSSICAPLAQLVFPRRRSTFAAATRPRQVGAKPIRLSCPPCHIPSVLHLPPVILNTAAPSPSHWTTPSPPRRGCSGRGRAAPVRAPGEAASGPTFSHNRSRVSPLASLAPHPVISGQEPPPVSSWPPAGTTLRAANSSQGDLCKGRACL